MKKYYYAEGSKSFGPFTLEELKDKHLTKDTKIWHKDLGDWTRAELVPELSDIINDAPPSIQQAHNNSSYPPNSPTTTQHQMPPKTWLVESILVTLFCCLPFGIAGIVNAANVESRFYAGDVEGAMRASNEAKKWTVIGFWATAILALLYFLLVIIMGTTVFSFRNW